MRNILKAQQESKAKEKNEDNNLGIYLCPFKTLITAST
jgi:hypothetical protein